MLFLLVSLTFSCSSDSDSNSELNQNAEKLLGTWGTLDSQDTFYKKFTFRNDLKAEYYTYPGGSQPELEEVGTWSMDGDILTMSFPETIELTFVQKVVFTNDTQVKFNSTGVSGEEAYSGTYYKQE